MHVWIVSVPHLLWIREQEINEIHPNACDIQLYFSPSSTHGIWLECDCASVKTCSCMCNGGAWTVSRLPLQVMTCRSECWHRCPRHSWRAGPQEPHLQCGLRNSFYFHCTVNVTSWTSLVWCSQACSLFVFYGWAKAVIFKEAKMGYSRCTGIDFKRPMPCC